MTSYDPFRPRRRSRPAAPAQPIPPSAGPPAAPSTEQPRVVNPEQPAADQPGVQDAAAPLEQPTPDPAPADGGREQRLTALDREDLVALAQLHGLNTRYVPTARLIGQLMATDADPANL